MTTSTTHRRPSQTRPRLTTRVLATWWGRTSAAVLTAGALAGAIASIANLLPWGGPDLVDQAQLTSVSVVRVPVPLGEYEARTELVPRALGAAADGAPGVVLVSAQQTLPPDATGRRTGAQDSGDLVEDRPPTATETGAPVERSGTPSPSPAPTTGTPPLDETASPAPAPSVPAVRTELSQLERQRVTAEVLPRLEEAAPDYDLHLPEPSRIQAGFPTLALVEAASVDEEGNPLPPDEAARRVVEVLGETRTQPQEGKQEPLGVLLDVNCDLQGLRGRPVVLTWEIFQAGGSAPLLGEWLRTTPAYRLRPTTEHDSASVDLWVPLPKEPGPYVVRLSLALDGGPTLHSAISEPFD